MRHLLSVKLFAIGLALVFVLAACAENSIPELKQDIPLKEVQQVEPEAAGETPTGSAQDIPAAQGQINQTPIDEPVSESNIVEESIADENQSPGSSYPPPESAGYPAPETGYPAPAEFLPTPTLMPAYPAPTEDQGESPSTDSESPPPVKTGLVATDPSTVKLASGGLQFVEFFAFW
jgi:hypothetical protein